MATIVRKVGGKPVRTSNPPARNRLASTSSNKTKTKPNIGLVMNLELPDEPAEPEYNLATSTIFIHGEPGIGKSDFAAQFDTALHMMFEPGGKYLRISRLPLTGQFSLWEQFRKVIDKLVKTDRFQTIVFDTADLAYELCTQYICEEAGEDHINDGNLGYGKGLDMVDAEFKKQILRITGTGRGVIFISHTKSQEFERSTGAKNSKLIATIRDRGRRFINGFVDITGYYGYYGDERRLLIRGDENVDAKCRIKGRFMTKDGFPVWSIPMGDSAEESYDNFLAAYNNEQEEDGKMKRKAELSEVKARFRGRQRK
jgi:hypothetical protein